MSLLKPCANCVNFNSRAHVERDWDLTVRTVAVLDISTHALTWSATLTD